MSVIRLARKVKSMPATEVAGRTLYQLDRLTERIRHRTVGLAAPSRLHRALLPSATAGDDWRHTLLEGRRRSRPPFYQGAETQDRMREQFASTYVTERSASILWADRALRHEVSFFGAPARLPPGAAVLGLRTGAAVLPAFTARLAGNRYLGWFEPPLELVRTGNARTDVQANTERIARAIEAAIRRYPEQWTVFQPIWPQG